MFGRGRKIAPYLFISPFFVGYAIFFLYPVIQSLQLELYRQVGLNKAPALHRLRQLRPPGQQKTTSSSRL